MGMVCPRLKEGTCRYRHLDTNDPRQLKEFNDLMAVMNSKTQPRSFKGKPKGRGKDKGKKA